MDGEQLNGFRTNRFRNALLGLLHALVFVVNAIAVLRREWHDHTFRYEQQHEERLSGRECLRVFQFLTLVRLRE